MARNDGARSTHSPWSACAVATYLTGFAALAALYLTQPILPQLGRVFDVDARQAASTVSLAILGLGLASPVVGVLSDRFGRHRLLLGGSVALTLVTGASAAAPDLVTLNVLRLVQGALLPTLMVVAVAYAADVLPADTMRTVAGIYVAATATGGMVGRLAAGAITDVASWRWAFVASAALFLALPLLWARLPRVPRGGQGRGLAEVARGTARHLLDGSVVRGVLAGFFVFFAFQGTFTYLPFRLEAPPFSFGPAVIGGSYLVFVAGIVSSSIAGRVAGRIGLRTALLTGFGLAALGNLLALANSLAALVTGLLVLCFGNWLVHALALGHVATAAETDRAGANSLYLLAYYLGGAAGAWAPGFVHQAVGFPGVIVGSVSALAIGAAIAATLPADAGAIDVPRASG